MGEYQPGFTRCNACDIDLVDHLQDVAVNVKRVRIDSTIQFFLLTYVVTWITTMVGLAGGIASSSPWFFFSRTLLLLGSLAPSLVALGLTASEEGTLAAKALLRHLFEWRIAARWYVLALCYPVSIVLSSDLAHRVIAGAWVTLSYPQWFAIVLSGILTMPVRASEEIGWRGYALPRLTKRFGLMKAALILGPIWACWHLPLFLIPGMANYGRSVSLFVLGVTAFSFAFAWVYWNTNGSLLPVLLMHSAIDEAFTVLPSPETVPNPLAFGSELMPWLMTVFAWVIAAYIIARMPRRKNGQWLIAVD
jgi:membrane protease YdiL (CAAX protease family)